MKSILKFLMTAIGLVLIATGIAAAVFSDQALALLQNRLTEYAAEALGSEVSIENIRISQRHAGLMLEGFTVAHPPQFKEGQAIVCEKILLEPAWHTIFSPTPTFKKITIQNADITLRHELGDGTNFGAFIRNIGAYLENEGTQINHAFPREIRVESVAFNSGKLRVTSGAFPIPPIPLDINAFEVNNVNEGNAVPVGKLMGVMLRDILLEALTLKGILKPIEAVFMGEVEEL